MAATVITGGGRGIGAAVVARLAGPGQDVVIGYATDQDSAETVAELARSQGARALTAQLNVADSASVAEFFDLADRWADGLTAVVANAGVTAHLGPLVDTPVAVIEQVIGVNLLGAILTCREAVRVLRDRGGAVVTISSVAAEVGSPGEYVHYAAAKAGVEALTIGLAKEVAELGIRVNCVRPGTVRTRIHADAGDPGRADRVAGRIPLGRPGEPDEIAAAVAWLLGPEAGYVTGAVLEVAGGL